MLQETKTTDVARDEDPLKNVVKIENIAKTQSKANSKK
jgi:hypothetical protein